MLNSRTRKTIKKIEQYAHIEAKKIADSHSQSKEDLYALSGYHLMEKMEDIVLDWESEKKHEYAYNTESLKIHKWEILLLRIAKIAEVTEKIECDDNEKYEFLCWYINEILNFFVDVRNFEKFTYSVAYTGVFIQQLEKGYPYYKIRNIILNFPYKCLEDRKTIKESFFMMNQLIQSLEKVSVDCVLSHETVLKRMGFDAKYINRLEEAKEKKQLVVGLKQTANLFAVTPTSSLFTNHYSEKNNQMDTLDSKKRKMLQKELTAFLNVRTLECSMPIQGETYQKVMQLLNQLYPENERIVFQKAIELNNQRWNEIEKQEIFCLLLNEEQQDIYNQLTVYCYQMPNAILYKEIMKKGLKQIDDLLAEYREIREEQLIPDYKEQIDLIYSEIATYLPYLPVEVVSKKARA